MPLVTLTTDFGLNDAYVATMKGVMLQIDSRLRFVDITHNVDAQDVMGAAFVLNQAIPHFPAGAVHLVVVDPDVGGNQKPIAARIGNSFFVGRDNGLLALLLRDRKPELLVALDNSAYWRTSSPSKTFHGRDIFAPVAAHIASGKKLTQVGTPLEEFQKLHWAHPLADEEGIQGFVVHIDHFGNCITNIAGSTLEGNSRSKNAKCYVGSAILQGIQSTYGDVQQGEPLALIGSSGYLEVAINGGNAAELLTIHKGSPVSLVFGDSDEEVARNIVSDLSQN
ncbi:MAG: SAM-dependent chlorinase/fluorinase [Rubricoccaceae bacterium]|nr:SAM-dependent chlorinase/fluorinase [Rubricoccaceae bacterium]